MKKILFSLLTVLLLILCGILVINGMNLFGVEILGISQIQEKNTQLDETITQATLLASTDYEKALDDVENDAKKLEEEKKTYEDLVAVNDDEEISIATQYQKYEIEYLWAVIGNHATSEGIDLKMDLVSGVQATVYNLNFTIRGSYIGISEFISTIENDPVLGFKIENFSIVPGGSTELLQATFTCKNIQILLSEKDNDIAINSDTTQANVTPIITDNSQTTENLNENSIQDTQNTTTNITEITDLNNY